MNVRSCGFHLRVAQKLYVFATKLHTVVHEETRLVTALNDIAVGKKQHKNGHFEPFVAKSW